jgi:hypothetical protein
MRSAADLMCHVSMGYAAIACSYAKQVGLVQDTVQDQSFVATCSRSTISCVCSHVKLQRKIIRIMHFQQQPLLYTCTSAKSALSAVAPASNLSWHASLRAAHWHRQCLALAVNVSQIGCFSRLASVCFLLMCSACHAPKESNAPTRTT